MLAVDHIVVMVSKYLCEQDNFKIWKELFA
jgi:hypothetical protein